METRTVGGVLSIVGPLKTPPTTPVFIQGVQGVEMRVLDYPEWKHAWWVALLSSIEPLKTPPTTPVLSHGIQGVEMQVSEHPGSEQDWLVAFSSTRSATGANGCSASGAVGSDH